MASASSRDGSRGWVVGVDADSRVCSMRSPLTSRTRGRSPGRPAARGASGGGRRPGPAACSRAGPSSRCRPVSPEASSSRTTLPSWTRREGHVATALVEAVVDRGSARGVLPRSAGSPRARPGIERQTVADGAKRWAAASATSSEACRSGPRRDPDRAPVRPDHEVVGWDVTSMHGHGREPVGSIHAGPRGPTIHRDVEAELAAEVEHVGIRAVLVNRAHGAGRLGQLLGQGLPGRAAVVRAEGVRRVVVRAVPVEAGVDPVTLVVLA